MGSFRVFKLKAPKGNKGVLRLKLSYGCPIVLQGASPDVKLCVVCFKCQEPSEGLKLHGSNKGQSSAGLWRTVHLAVLSHRVRTIKAVQEDGGYFCNHLPVNGCLGHAVDGTLQIRSGMHY